MKVKFKEKATYCTELKHLGEEAPVFSVCGDTPTVSQISRLKDMVPKIGLTSDTNCKFRGWVP